MPGIDLHTHLAPRLTGPLPAGIVQREDGRLVVDGTAIGLSELYEPGALIAHLDRHGLDEGIVSVPPPFYRQELRDPLAAAIWIEALNDGLLTAIATSPRLTPLAYLPLEQPELAVAEASRCTAAFAGFTAAAGGRSPSLADPVLEPLLRLLDERRALLLLHPGVSPDPRMVDLYLANLLGNPVETSLAAAQLTLGGVIAEYPRLRFMLVHGGGAVAALAGRWERGVESERPGLPAGAERPLRAVRRLYVDTVTHDTRVTALAAEVIGRERIVLGSDWPFPMGAYGPDTVPAELAAAARGTNARAALGRELGR